MSNKHDETTQAEQERQDEYMRRGKGRRDEVGGSGIYPASSPNVPADAAVRSPGDFGSHKGPGRKQRPSDPGVGKADKTSGSE